MGTPFAPSALIIAALIAGSPAALAQTAPFCLKSSSGMINCAFATAAQCEVAKGMNLAAQCIPNPMLSTTGQGSGTPTRDNAPTPPPSPSTR
jgi:hypothetical protein